MSIIQPVSLTKTRLRSFVLSYIVTIEEIIGTHSPACRVLISLQNEERRHKTYDERPSAD